jgi:hypothetical protein
MTTDVAPRTLTGRLAKKLLMSFAATAVTGVAGYAGKKAPQLIEDRLMPKLREVTPKQSNGADEPAESPPPETESPPRETLSPAQRDKRRRQRAAQRKARQTASGAKEA